MLQIILAISLFLQTCIAGSPCPPRENIYPCSCLYIKGPGSFSSTVVQCHRLQDKATLDVVFRSLQTMKIEYFNLYDSFWYRDSKALPHDWLASLRSKIIEIVDTAFEPCFACDLKFPCKNIETTRFVMKNSTGPSNFCTLCPTGRNNSYPWITCMLNLQELQLIGGKIETLGADFFPSKLEALRKLNLSHNEIRIINQRSFQGLQTLISMDLSHNRIVSLENMFVKPMELLDLDVSWNKIEKLDAMFFRMLPKLKSFLARSNHIVHLVEEHWKNIPQSLKLADLEDNPLKCHCNMNWVNQTIPKQTSLKGYCSSEKLYQTKNLKLRIKYILQWCERMNRTTTLKPSKSTRRSQIRTNEYTTHVAKEAENLIYID